jgi:hypothetical protein
LNSGGGIAGIGDGHFTIKNSYHIGSLIDLEDIGFPLGGIVGGYLGDGKRIWQTIILG